jgi:hypothetical protein
MIKYVSIVTNNDLDIGKIYYLNRIVGSVLCNIHETEDKSKRVGVIEFDHIPFVFTEIGIYREQVINEILL